MTKLKLAIFSQHFYPENFRINFLVDELKKKNEITIFTSNPHYNLKTNIIKKYKKRKPYLKYEKKINIWRFPVIFQKKNLFFKLLNYLSYILSLTYYSKIFLKKNFDLIFVYSTSPILQSLPAILYKIIKRKPLVIWVQDLWPDVLLDIRIPFNKQLSVLIKPVIKWIYNKSDLILCQSNSFVQSIKKVVEDKNKVKLYYNPSDIKKINSNKRLSNKNFNIMFAGNFGESQNLEIIINVAKNIKKNKDNIIIKLIGNGNQFFKIYNLVKKNKLEGIINLYGYLSYKKILKHYLNTNALILTLKNGKALNKTIPAKFQTYLAFKKPILIAANGEVNRIVKKENLGLTTSSGNYKGLYKNILKLKKMNFYNYSKMAFNCEKFYKENFLLKKSAEDLQNKFIKLLKANDIKENIL